LQTLEEEGHTIPELQNQPELFSDLIFYYSAFQELSTSRQSGFGIGHIPRSEIRGYLDDYDITAFEERLECFRWIQFIDREFVKLHNEDANKKKTQKPKKSHR
jgi:hypothetical protein